jgi:hypothetical protein
LFPMFAWYALRYARQASRAEGNLAAKLLRERRNTFWTVTLWTGEAAMKHFVSPRLFPARQTLSLVGRIKLKLHLCPESENDSALRASSQVRVVLDYRL